MAKRPESKEDLILQVDALCKDYEGPHGALRILKGIQFGICRSEMVMILGRSGSGKSTLLHLLGGLDKPTSGMIRFQGKDLAALSDRQISEYRSKHVGFIFQLYYLLPELTLFENVLLPTRISKRLKKDQAEHWLERVGLLHRRDHYPSQLSGGEQQRAAIARALVNNPSVIFCDEPTGNLDEETASSIFDLLLKLNREEKKTFVIVTHELSLVNKSRTVYELHEGTLAKK